MGGSKGSGDDSILRQIGAIQQQIEPLRREAAQLTGDGSQRTQERLEAVSRSLEELFASAREQITRQKHHLSRRSEELIYALETESQLFAGELVRPMNELPVGLGILGMAVEHLPPDLDSWIGDQLDGSRDLVAGAVNELHRVSLSRVPFKPNGPGLIAALSAYLEPWLKLTGTKVDLEARPTEERLPPEVETTVFRLVQDALIKVQRHTQARAAHVIIGVEEAKVTVEVQDDGVEFDVRRAESQSWGLRLMRERVKSVGGSMQVQSQPEGGTRIVVEIPLRQTL